MVRRIFLYFLREKREGLAFERLKFVSSTTGTSATGSAFNFVECFVTNNRRGDWTLILMVLACDGELN